jgi:apolipoprotein N-acyltransferase
MAGVVPRRGRVVAPSLLAGGLLAASLPPWGWWPLAFAGAALLFWRLAGLPLRARLLAGWATGLGWFVPGLWWAGAFNWYGAAVLIMVEALFPAVAAGLVPPRRWRAPAFTGAFTLLEAARMAWPFGGLPVGGVFLGQAGGPLLPVARVGGPLLLGGLVFLGGAGLASVAAAALRAGPAALGDGRGRPAPSSEGRAAPGLLAVLLVVLAGVGGALAPDGGPPLRRVTVALVQGGGRRGTSASEVPATAVFAAQVDATARVVRAARRADPPALVVWPEDVIAVGRTLAHTREAAYMSALARRLRATVVAGVTETISATRYRNEAVAWAPDGRIAGVYEKVHRVPFGEYVPYRGLFSHLADLSAVPRDAVPGRASGALTTPAGRLGIMVSYEVFFAARGRAAVRAGAELLVVPTNTSSYAASQVPAMEVAADRVQAVAEGRDLVQAAPTGYSTVVDPSGDVLRRSGLGRRQVLLATVALRRGATPYERFGDAPVLVAAAAALVAGLALAAADARRRRRQTPSAAPPRDGGVAAPDASVPGGASARPA